MAHAAVPPPTLEEILRLARARFALLSDVLELHALGIERADHPIAPDASRALAETCRQATTDIQALLTCLPAEWLNWSDSARAEKRHRSR